jgi:hypothetical protein
MAKQQSVKSVSYCVQVYSARATCKRRFSRRLICEWLEDVRSSLKAIHAKVCK